MLYRVVVHYRDEPEHTWKQCWRGEDRVAAEEAGDFLFSRPHITEVRLESYVDEIWSYWHVELVWTEILSSDEEPEN